jgi:hypothetical protein
VRLARRRVLACLAEDYDLDPCEDVWKFREPL